MADLIERMDRDSDRGDIERTIAGWKERGLPAGLIWLALTGQYRETVGWAEVTGYMLGVVALAPQRQARLRRAA